VAILSCLCTFLYIRGADKSLAFPVSPMGGLQHTQRNFLDGLKKLEQRSHTRVELRGEYVE
jgi:hypothetical protein